MIHDDVDAADFLATSGIKQQIPACNTPRAWMLNGHRFRVVDSLSEVAAIVDGAIAQGEVALDLECEGLDNRIYYKKGKPYTVHKIVGYCLSIDGVTGYYIPVGHGGDGWESNLPAEEVAKEIARLCFEAQPVIKEGEAFPLTSRNYTPGVVKIYFWNAKYDQEMLFPVIGLDWWHPDSFEDGMLKYFAVHAGGELGLKPRAHEDLKYEGPEIVDSSQLRLDYESDPGFIRVKYTGEVTGRTVKHPYAMLELTDIFKGREIRFSTLIPKDAALYAASDAICTLRLCSAKYNRDLCEEVRYRGAEWTYRLERSTVQVVRRMERNRVYLDRKVIEEVSQQADDEANQLAQKIKDIASAAGFGAIDPNSAKQIGDFLFDEKPGCLHLTPSPGKNEASGQWKTGGDELEALSEELGEAAPEILTLIVKYRSAAKVKGTYIDNMLKGMDPNGEIRINFKQVGAATARFATPKGKHSQGFCGFTTHGIPKSDKKDAPETAKALRKTFKARPGYVMVKIDYAGEELRIAANLSGEPLWVNEFLHGTGDLHTITAIAFFGDKRDSPDWPTLRGMAKAGNFAMLFGGGAGAIMRATGCSKEEGIRKKKSFDATVTAWAKWVKMQHAKVKADGGVRNAFDRWIEIPNANAEENFLKAEAERRSLNFAIQGSGADIIRISKVICHQEAQRRGWLRDWMLPESEANRDLLRILLTVHDELVFEVHESIAFEATTLMKEVMERPTHLTRFGPKWRVPLVAEALIGESWDAKYGWEELTHGKPYKEGTPVSPKHYVHEGRLYRVPPSGLIGKPGFIFDPAVHQPGVVVGVSDAPASAPEAALPPSVNKGPEPVTLTLGEASEFSAWVMGAIVQVAHDPEGTPLVVTGPGGEVLLSQEEGFRVDPAKVRFFHMLFKL